MDIRVSIPSNRGISPDKLKVKGDIWIYESQSPQIGAFLRTTRTRNLPATQPSSLNPLKSGHFSGLCAVPEAVLRREIVSSQSPQIGAFLRTRREEAVDELEQESQSPQIGAFLRTLGRGWQTVGARVVSIPSNRGISPDRL